MEAKFEKTDNLYIHEQYNVTTFTPNPNSLLRDVMAKMVNVLIKALNDTLKLPRLIVVIPDCNILEFVKKDDEGIKIVSSGAVNWIIKQMIRAIDSKKDHLRRLKPGAITAGEPKFVWIKMMNRVNGHYPLSQYRDIYNNELEKMLAAREEHFVMDLSSEMSDINYFDQFNQLNGHGRRKFWYEVDRKLEWFDKKKISLKPRIHNNIDFGEAARRSLQLKYNSSQESDVYF